MPFPVLEPTPGLPRELRFVPPDEAQEASYLAASARMASFSMVGRVADMFYICSIDRHASSDTCLAMKESPSL